MTNIEDLTDLKKMVFYPTNLCNLGCRFCWRTSNPNDQQNPYERGLNKEKCLRIIKNAINMGCEEFTFSGGGEPLMRKELILEIAHKIQEVEVNEGREINTTLVTNGTLLTKKIIKELYESNWDSISISVHGANAKLVDYLMGKGGSFKKIIEGIKKIKGIKENRKQKPILRSNFVINRFNYKKPVKMAELAKFLDIQTINFILLVRHDESISRFTLNKKEEKILQRELKKAQKIADGTPGLSLGFNFEVKKLAENKFGEFERDDFVNKKGQNNSNKNNEEKTPEEKNWESNWFFTPKNKSSFCPIPFREIVILPSGDVYPCCSYPKLDGDVVDNIKGKTLEEVWNGERMQEFRKRMLNHSPVQGCMDCNPDMTSYKRKIKEEIQ